MCTNIDEYVPSLPCFFFVVFLLYVYFFILFFRRWILNFIMCNVNNTKKIIIIIIIIIVWYTWIIVKNYDYIKCLEIISIFNYQIIVIFAFLLYFSLRFWNLYNSFKINFEKFFNLLSKPFFFLYSFIYYLWSIIFSLFV